MSQVTISKLVKRYGEITVLNDIDVTIDDQEFAVIVGPSGCGKSTLLRSIAGLEEVSEGSILIGDRDVTHEDAAERGVAMVFQSYALYPHMSVRANIGFSLRMQGVSADRIAERVEEVARILQLEQLLDRKPRHLSGGQRQRVAIGRAIIRNPEVFLFDEPLSNLDAELRVAMRSELTRLHRDINGTMIYVTHDQVEAMTLADKIIVMRDGIIEQIGTASQLYDDPDNEFVASFLGTPKTNVLPCSCANDGQLSLTCGQKLYAKDSRTHLPAHSALKLTIRPEYINRPEAPNASMKLSGGVEVVENLGSLYNVHLDVGNGQRMIVQHRDKDAPRIGDRYEVRFNEEDIRFFDDSGQRIRLAERG